MVIYTGQNSYVQITTRYAKILSEGLRRMVSKQCSIENSIFYKLLTCLMILQGYRNSVCSSVNMVLHKRNVHE